MIALIAGTGLLPAVLTEHLRGQAKPFTVCALQGNLPTLSADLSPWVFRPVSYTHLTLPTICSV